MSQLPDIKGPDREKPLCYDPQRKKYIYFEELINGQEKVIPLEELTHEELKQLVIKRQLAGPDYIVQVMNGKEFARDKMVQEIKNETEFGKMSMNAEISYLSELLKQINESLKFK